MTRTIAFALTGLMLAFPASGQAAQTFGSLLKNSPAPGPDPCVDTAPGPCTLVAFINPNDVGDPVSSPAPGDGVIVRFRIRTMGAEAVTLRLATATKQGDTILAQATRTGPTVTTQGTGEIEEFPARLQVVKGELLALDAPSTRMVYNQGGNEFTPLYAPPLVEGQGPRGPGGDPTGELLLQAVMEADADGDGFGDESQDACPTQSSTQGACDNAGPGVSRVAVGARAIRYRLSEAATVGFRVQRAAKGRRVRGRCRRETSSNRNRRRCTRYVSLRGSFTDDGKAGPNVRSLPARFRARRLGPGRYRLLITARDQFGNETKTTKRFVIRR
jgi:hypothetical protein